MKISEIFHSLQGEGKLLGLPSVFLRASGCNLRCTWCDTPYASWNPEGDDLPLDQILHKLLSYNTQHIVLTGGEPMMFKEMVPLITSLKQHQKHITIETAGTLWLDEIPVGGIDLASISPKLKNSTPYERDNGRFAQSHEKNRLNLPILQQFATSPVILDRQWKFVLSSPSDLEEIHTLISQINACIPPQHHIQPQDILLMPEGTDPQTLSSRSLWLADLCKHHHHRLSPRLHIHLYGNTKGT